MKLLEYLRAHRTSGGQLAALLGVSQPTVSDWCTGKKLVPPKKCVRIYVVTGGGVTFADLRRDWAEIWPVDAVDTDYQQDAEWDKLKQFSPAIAEANA